MTTERYDKIGIGYDSTRKADSYLTQKMFSFLCTGQSNSQYLDVGCGTGNYTTALHQMGLNFIGIEPSDEMLRKAKAKNSAGTNKSYEKLRRIIEDTVVPA